MLTTEQRLLPHNRWLAFRDGVPAGFAEDANVSLLCNGLFFLSLLLLLLLLLIVFVAGPHEDIAGLPQLCHSGLETMGILGGFDAMQQLFEKRADTSQGNNLFIADLHWK